MSNRNRNRKNRPQATRSPEKIPEYPKVAFSKKAYVIYRSAVISITETVKKVASFIATPFRKIGEIKWVRAVGDALTGFVHNVFTRLGELAGFTPFYMFSGIITSAAGFAFFGVDPVAGAFIGAWLAICFVAIIFVIQDLMGLAHQWRSRTA